MISPSIQDATGIAAATRTAEAEALAAAGAFGAALQASPEFTALVAADAAISTDPAATAAIDAFRTRQVELRTEAMMGVLTAAQRVELERLQAAMLAVPSIASYVAATAAFQSVCRETAAVVSAQIGIDFAANCRAGGGCCG
ncbi:MAG: YlbF family regulator [Chloroflexota bacterium]